MKKLLLLLCSFFLLQHTYSQINSAKIVGTVTDSVGSPITYATIILKNSNKGTTTDSKGNYTVSNLPAGSFTVLISAVGYHTQSQVVELADKEIKELSVSLKMLPRLLNEVVVTSRRRDERKENLTSSISVVSPQTIQQLQTVSNNAADILAVAVPGLGVSSGTSSNWGQSLRGRQVLVLVDGVPQSTPLRNGSMDIRVIDPYAIERIEVIKGATSIYGNGAAGGIINYITKSNTGVKKFSSKTELATTGSIVHSEGSLGARAYQSFYGRAGKFDYTVSGSFEQTGQMKDAQGDIIGPIYSLSNNEIYNGFAKAGYNFSDKQRLQFSYNYFGSQEQGDLKEVLGSIREGRKTTSVPGYVTGSSPGTRWNHTGLLKYSHDNLFANHSLNVSAYLQDISTVFFYSNQFEGGGQSTIQSVKRGLRLDLSAPFALGNRISGNLAYGVDLLKDATSQPLLDGRTWVPEMNLGSTAPFLQVQSTLFNNLVYNGGVRFESMDIAVADYTTLKPYNAQTRTFGTSINVKGGNIGYNNLVFNSGLKYNRFNLFKPYVNFSQGFSVADLGLVLRAARVTDIANIQTEAVIVNNYEVGFASEHNIFRFEAAAYMSKSKLGSSFQEINGFYTTVRSPEKVHGFELAADAYATNNLTVGATYTYVEGKRDSNNNGKFEDAADTYLGGERISPPKYTAYVKYTPLQHLNFRLDYIGSGARDRFQKGENGLYKTYEGKVTPYSIINLASSYRMSPSTTIKVGIENLLNADYFPTRAQWLMFDQYYIKGKGTSFTLGLTVDI
ncbi:TonB-dependent receptor [Adhaeribacter aerolatus]|uniref:TonB-dependent receptor n=1 Tax=Adhaeribacter aerolatus TaxID=670289 RepID=UPI0011BF456D|nr:TonB-dependent receptor [Adhaeribacter aerolatus]